MHYSKTKFNRINPPFAALMVFIQEATEQQITEFHRWNQNRLKTVFAIDDMDALRVMIPMMVNRISQDLISVGTAKDFNDIRQLEVLTPDILIIDHMLPGRDGFDVMRHYRQKLPKTTFVFHSFRWDDESTIAKADETGADAIIQYGCMMPNDFIASLEGAYNKKATSLGFQSHKKGLDGILPPNLITR